MLTVEADKVEQGMVLGMIQHQQLGYPFRALFRQGIRMRSTRGFRFGYLNIIGGCFGYGPP